MWQRDRWQHPGLRANQLAICERTAHAGHFEETITAAYYQIRVKGQLNPHWSAWFDGLGITHDADGDTTLEGRVADHAALYRLLSKARDLGLTLISVARRAPEPDAMERTLRSARNPRG
jgi:hypothetical protein